MHNLVHNFWSDYLGYSQIQTVFGQEYVWVKNLQGYDYDQIAQYNFHPGEYDSKVAGDDENGCNGGSDKE